MYTLYGSGKTVATTKRTLGEKKKNYAGTRD